jgi:hypothetical protein
MTFEQVVLRSAPQGLRRKACVRNAPITKIGTPGAACLKLVYRVKTMAIGEAKIRKDRPYCFFPQSFDALGESLNPMTTKWTIGGID